MSEEKKEAWVDEREGMSTNLYEPNLGFSKETVGKIIQIGGDVENISMLQVAQVLTTAVTQALEFTNSITIIVDKEKQRLCIKLNQPVANVKNTKRRLKKITKKAKITASVWGGDMSKGFIEKKFTKWQKDGQYAFSFIEGVMDIWGRYALPAYQLEVDKEKEWMAMYYLGIDGDELKNYILDKEYLGWNVDGNFWKRDWLRKEQRDSVVRGGYIG